MIDGHGDDLYRYHSPITANFSSNLTNWIDPTPLKTFLSSHVGETLCAYPEPQPYTLEARLAETLDIAPSEICVTNGATEAIYLTAQCFAGSATVVVQPTFSEYADACRLHRHRVGAAPGVPRHAADCGNPDMLWLCNPNNPTGEVTDKERLMLLAKENPAMTIVVDQSYESFTRRPLLTAAETVALPNVLLLHSMTKRYAMPGLRLGFVTGNATLLRRLRSQRMPWSVNAVAILAGMFLAANPEAIPFDLDGCLKETERLQAMLRDTGALEITPTDTHFMLVQTRKGDAAALKDFLAIEQGILIRNAANFEGLGPAHFRISTQLPRTNDLLVGAIGKWLNRQ